MSVRIYSQPSEGKLSAPYPILRIDKIAYCAKGRNAGFPYAGLAIDDLSLGYEIADDQKRLTLTIGPIGSEHGTLEVFFPTEKGEPVLVRRGCYTDVLENFAAKAANHNNDTYRHQYQAVVKALQLIVEAFKP